MILNPSLPRIVAYHSIFDAAEVSLSRANRLVVSTSDFDAQIRYLARNFTLVTVAELASCVLERKPFPSRALAITFDDGYANNVELALPILRRHGARATFYLVAGFVGSKRLLWEHHLEALLDANRDRRIELTLGGRRLALDLASGESRWSALMALQTEVSAASASGLDALPDAILGAFGRGVDFQDSPYRPMQWEQARELLAAGMEIGAHTSSHTPITRMTRDETVQDLRSSRATLLERLGVDVVDHCYVGGFCDNSSGDRLQEAGFRSATTIRGDFVDHDCSPLYLPRMVIYAMPWRDFQANVDGVRASARRALPRWVYTLRGRTHPVGRTA